MTDDNGDYPEPGEPSPAPWDFCSHSDRETTAIKDAEGEIVAIIQHDAPTPRTEADGRMIIAAPAMLAALKRQQANIRRWMIDGIPADAEESRSISEQIDAAVAKAEGKP